MGRTGDPIFVIAVLGGIAAWVIWGWASRTRRRSEAFSPLALFSLIGFSLASLSALLRIATGVYAQFTDGFPFNDPTLLRIYVCGLLLTTLGLVSGLCGSFRDGPLRFKAPALSTFLLLFWIAQMISE
jgi:uncharacterized membrane protein